MNAADAICDRDLDHGEDEPIEACVDCGGRVAAGCGGLCEDCDDKRETFEANGADPRR